MISRMGQDASTETMVKDPKFENMLLLFKLTAGNDGSYCNLKCGKCGYEFLVWIPKGGLPITICRNRQCHTEFFWGAQRRLQGTLVETARQFRAMFTGVKFVGIYSGSPARETLHLVESYDFGDD